jgi:hypothetical protein
VGVLLAVLGAGVAIGTSRWQGDPVYQHFYGAAGTAVDRSETVAAPTPPSVALTIR